MSKKYDVVVVGSGPAGIFSAYELINLKPDIKILVIDKGRDINSRSCPIRDNKTDHCVKCNPCHIMSGFGGAGAFSDCKLSLSAEGVGGCLSEYIGVERANKYVNLVDEIFSKFDNQKDNRKIIGKEITEEIKQIIDSCDKYNIKYTYCPTKHLGTDGTYNVMCNMQDYLINRGVEFAFNTEVLNVKKVLNKNFTFEQEFIIETASSTDYLTNNVILAPGRSGNLWVKHLAESLNIKTKNNKVDIGVRVETNADITKKLTDNLYDVKLSYTNLSGDKVRMFCTNPNGFVSEEHYNIDGKNIAIANGHSFADKKSENTNFALLVTLEDEKITSDFIKGILEVYHNTYDGKLVVQNCVEFISDSGYKTKIKNSDTKPTLNTAVFGDLNLILPARVTNLIKTMLIKLDSSVTKHIRWNDTWLYGIETKFYSDLIRVDENMQTDVLGIYCIGDGSGTTRGITQSASEGLIAAQHIYKNISNKRCEGF